MPAPTPRPPHTTGPSGRSARPRNGAAAARRRRVVRRRWTALGVAVVLAAAVVLLVAGRGSGVAPSVEVAGVDLGRPEPQATAALVARARAIVARPIDLRAGTVPISVVRPADLGARPLVGRTIQTARESEPNILLRGARTLAGVGPEHHPLLVSYPDGALERWAGNIAEMVDQPAMPGPGAAARRPADRGGGADRAPARPGEAGVGAQHRPLGPALRPAAADHRGGALAEHGRGRAGRPAGARDPLAPGHGAGRRAERPAAPSGRGPRAALRRRRGRREPDRPGRAPRPRLPPPRAAGPLGALRRRGRGRAARAEPARRVGRRRGRGPGTRVGRAAGAGRRGHRAAAGLDGGGPGARHPRARGRLHDGVRRRRAPGHQHRPRGRDPRRHDHPPGRHDVAQRRARRADRGRAVS